MKIYTKTGDKGMTGLFGGTRVSKSNLRIDSYGSVDELNSFLGLIRDQKIDKHTLDSIIEIQKNLFVVGAVLATPIEKKILKNGKKRLANTKVTDEMILFLESEIDSIEETLPKITHFVLPGGHSTVSYCHIARSICRRAERLVVKISEYEEIEDSVLVYLNRLSDYLFVLARKLTFDNKATEIKWIP
ncbi:cob(I)yrinic acid a,c-diamide adenosyltransferase [Flavicella sp.]|uniref:cob(I)yrinic acid a,c-diamide adenosyltransferase n=1 Tax=Flavicella sp. TaxID=2957742 RepID=UPI003017E7BD